MTNSLKINSIGSGTPLVFIHGWGLNSGVWQSVASKLSANFQVITVDLPGFGLNNEFTLNPYKLEAVAEAVEQAVKSETTEQAVYLGWSLGGLVATQLTLQSPEHVKGLVTITSSPCFVDKPDWPGIEDKLLANFHVQLAKNATKTIDTFLKIQAMGSPHIRDDIKRMHELVMQYPQPNKENLDASLNLLEQIDLRDQLVKIKQPFLRLYGRLDSLVPKKATTAIDQLAPNSTCYVFKKASHAPFISHEDEFLQVLSDWLEEYIQQAID